MDVCPDFVSPIEQHWKEAAALRDSRTRTFLHSSSTNYDYDSGTASQVLLRRHRNQSNAERDKLSSRSNSRPSSLVQELPTRTRRRSQNGTPNQANQANVTPSPANRDVPIIRETRRPRDEYIRVPVTSDPPVCMAPPDILPIYEQKQLFAAAAINSRLTSSSRHNNNPYSSPLLNSRAPFSNPNRRSNVHELTRLVPTQQSQGGRLATSPSVGAQGSIVNPVTSTHSTLRSSRTSLTGGTSASSINSLLSTADRSPSLSRRNSDKPVKRIECKPNQEQIDPSISNFKDVKPVVQRNTPIVARRTAPIISRQPSNLQQKISLKSHLAFSAGGHREIFQHGSHGYNFRPVPSPKPYPVIFDSDSASTISDEFYVPFKSAGNFYLQIAGSKSSSRASSVTKRFIRSQDITIGALSNECSLEFRIPKFYSKEVADWSISSSVRQNRKCCLITRAPIRVWGCKAAQEACEGRSEDILLEDVDSMIVPPRRFYAKVHFLHDVSANNHKHQFAEWVEQNEVSVCESRQFQETNLDYESSCSSSGEVEDILEDYHHDTAQGELSSEDVFGTSDEKETEPEVELQVDLPASSSDEFRLEQTSGSDDVLSTHKDDDFNSVLVMQLFNLIGRLTEEMKQLERDCVEMRAELAELKHKSEEQMSSHHSVTSSNDDRNLQLCQKCSAPLQSSVSTEQHKNQKTAGLKDQQAELKSIESKLATIPLDMQREVQIPIALTRTVMKEKRKKTIREKVFGLGRVSRSKRNHSFSVSATKSRFSFDGEECDDFSIGRRPSEPSPPEAPPIYDLPPFELDERFKAEFVKRLVGKSGQQSTDGSNVPKDATGDNRNKSSDRFLHVDDSAVGGSKESDGNFGLTKFDRIKRYQSESRRTWREECAGHLKEGPQDGTSESVDDHPRSPQPPLRRNRTEGRVPMEVEESHSQERSVTSSVSGTTTTTERLLHLSERDMNAESNQQFDGKSDANKFIEWAKRMEKSEALFLDGNNENDSTDMATRIKPRNSSAPTEVATSTPVVPKRFLTPPPRRIIRPPDNLPSALDCSDSTVQEMYNNWMEYKSTKAPRLSPDHGGDLKVRFDVNVREKTYFKDEVPKMSSIKSGMHFKSRMQTRLRHCASSLAKKVKRTTRGREGKRLRSDSGEYEDLDFLDQRVSRLAEQSDQLCRNLTLEAQAGLRFGPTAPTNRLAGDDDEAGFFAHQQQRRVELSSALISDENNDEESHDSYIDLSTLDPDDVKLESPERTESRSLDTNSEIKSECLCTCAHSAAVPAAIGEGVENDDVALRDENLTENVFDELSASSESFIKASGLTKHV